MAQLHKGNYSALMWLQEELQKSLTTALQALQDFIDTNDTAVLSDCIEQLYQANGTLQMLNLEGAQMLTIEMQALCQQLRGQTLVDAEGVKETLLRSLLLLPNYLKLVSDSFPDHPLCLIDSINELRNVRQQPPYLAQDLFKPQTTVILPELVRPDPSHPPPKIDIEPKQLAAAYQRLLLNWLQKQDDSSLRKMRGIFNYLRLASHQEKVTQLWWAAESMLEAILQRGLTVQADIKQLLGKLASPLKIVVEQREDVLLPVFPDSLLKQLLLIVARANSRGPLVTSLKDTYGLHFFDQQKAIYGISDNALSDAYVGLLEELDILKTLVTNFEQTASDAPAILGDINQRLLNMAETLSMLNQQANSELLHKQHQDLASIAEETPEDAKQILNGLADSLLQLEAILKQHGNEQASVVNTELQKVVIQEALFELGNIKENMALAAQQGMISSQSIDDTCKGLQMITGSLDMLNLSEAAGLLNDTVSTLQKAPFDQTLTTIAVQQLAEILSASELYMESIQQHGHSSLQLIDNAKRILDNFGDDTTANDIDTRQTSLDDLPQAPAEKRLTSVAQYIAKQTTVENPQTSVERYLQKLAEPSPQPSEKQVTSVELYLQKLSEIAPQQTASFDSDIPAIKEDDVSKELLTINNEVEESPNDYELATINYSLDNDLTSEPEPEPEPEPKPKPKYDLHIDMSTLAEAPTSPDWEDPLSVSPSLSDQLQPTAEPTGFAEGVDPEIAEVFLEEAEEVIAELNSLIPDWQKVHDKLLLDDIRRHFHTLKGSGRMAGATAIGEVARTIEDLLNRISEGLSVDTDKLSDILQQAPSTITDMVNRFSNGDMETTQTAQQLSEHVAELSNGIDMQRLEVPESDQSALTLMTIAEPETNASEPLTSAESLIDNQIDSAISETHKPLTGVSLYIERQSALAGEQKTTIESDDDALHGGSDSVGIELDEDAELLDIFLSEAHQHIQTLIEKSQYLHVGDSIDKSQLSAAHSLKGCANIAGVTSVALIATELDEALRLLYRQQQALNADDLSLIRQIYQNLSQFVAIIQGDNNDPDISVLYQQIKQLRLVAPSENQHVMAMDPERLVSFLEETDALLDRFTRQLTEWQQTGEQNQQQALHDILHNLSDNAQLAELPSLADLYQLLDNLIQHPKSADARIGQLLDQAYEMLNNQIEALIQNKPMADLAPLHEEIGTTLAALEAIPTERSESDSASKLPPSMSPPEDDYDAVDPDLLDAFTEEAAELLNSSNEAIKSWQQTPDDNAAAMQLQRDLHTLKGGARLTGVNAIADLAHQIETLVEPVCDGQKLANEDFFDLLQRNQDQLSIMQEQLASRRPIGVNDSLLAEIAAFVKGEPFVIETPPVETNIISPVEPSAPSLNPAEQIRVRADLLDYLSNFAGEVSISRDRVTQQHQALRQQLREMEETVSRLHEQLRKLEIETETQILFRYEDGSADHHAEFDPLELDRFSTIQQLSRSLTESVIDLNDISHSMDQMVRETDVILLQQSRLNTDLQQGLMRTRLVPFSYVVPRLERIVRQTCNEVGKQAQLQVNGANQELDRAILDRLVAPIEHILRNAIAHGIQTPSERQLQGKTEIGQLQIDLQREGSEIVLSISDDGQGLNLNKIYERALALKLIAPDQRPSDDALMQLILTSGFSTADNISQLAGRGVGMDVVNNEIRALKGRLSIESVVGEGSCFHIRLPLTLSLIQALLVTANQQQFAIPLSTVKAGERLSVGVIRELLLKPDPVYSFNDEDYEFIPLSHLLGQALNLPDNARQPMPMLLFRSGNVRVALLVDAINSNREIVIKSLGKQLSHINAINGATILGDGRVVLILDIPTLIEVHRQQHTDNTELPEELALQQDADERLPIAMVVDDSITMRKASSNLLSRIGFTVMTAKDGVEALAQLYEQQPDIILLDVEMPRMDGFEFASIVRNDPQFKHLPIIMITSRTGDKHRQRALGIGVNDYLGKPYQENELVSAMKQLLGVRYPHRQH